MAENNRIKLACARVMRNRQVIGLGRTAEIIVWGKNQVLKLFRDDCSLSAVKWEEKVARAVSEAGLPVPAVYDTVEVEGRHGIIYERIDGSSMLEEFIAKPDELKQFAKLFAELHVKIHSIEIGDLPLQRQRLEEKIRNAKPLSEKIKNAALKSLRQLADDNVLCHGDFHPDNILMSMRGPIVIDWNDVSLGNPLADIARTLLLLNPSKDLIVDYLTQKLGHQTKYNVEQIQASLNLFTDTYLKQYSQSCPISIDDFESWRLPVTAARLSEGIKEEESRLVLIVETLSRAC